MSVKGLKKANTKCEHASSNGCTIYKDRPDACSHFECLWLTNNWADEYRPDKSGIMLVGFKNHIAACRVSDDVNESLFNLIKQNNGVKKVKGYDCRNVSA